MKSVENKVKMAIIGSGAIAEEGYLPAAKLVPNLQITHLVDLDQDRARAVADRFGIKDHLTDYHGLFDEVDAVVVATPPNSHATISKDFLNHGIHVLCEKPLAMSVAEAREMVETGKKAQAHLAVGMVRRLSWSAQTLKQLVADGVLGKIKGFDVIEGWEFNWPLRTGHIFKNENSRGVIADTGPHLFDLLLWILDCDLSKIESCVDDNWGGIEPNAEIRLRVEKDGYSVSGTIELSFTRRLRNSIKIIGETGCLEAETVGARQVYFYPAGGDNEPMVIQPLENKGQTVDNVFGMQLSNFVASIVGDTVKHVPGEEAVATMELIESCYQLREYGAHSWEKLYLEHFFGEN